jgi:hypothetical protein
MGGPAFEAFPSLSMTRVDSISDGRGWLEDLKDFAVAKGWSNESYQTNVQWGDTGGGVYGWIAGSGDFLQISSTGYGSQKLRYRFYAVAGTGEHTITWQLIRPAFNAVDSAKSSLPYATTDHHCVSQFNNSMVISLPNTTYPGCWFIGNDRFIAWENEVVSSNVLVSGAVGTFELHLEYQNIANELACRWPGFYRNSATKWSEYATYPDNFTPPNARLGITDNSDYIIYWDGAGRSGTGTDNASLGYATTCAPIGDEPSNWSVSQFGRDNQTVKYSLNSYSNKRVLVKPKILLRDSADSFWTPAGSMPFYNTSVQGLAMGEQITYGGNTYICFPNGQGTYTYGRAYPIT